MTSASVQETNVLVLGGGFAGVGCAQRLEKLLPPECSITLINSENYFVFQPLLPEVVGASLAPSHVISPLRHLLRRTRVVLGEVCKIDLQPAGSATAGRVTVRADGVFEVVQFQADHLVLALGSIVDVSRIPGMAEQAFLMKNVADALVLRHAIIARLERAVLEPDPVERRALLTFVVVGGGFSGIETAAELNDLLKNARKFFPTLAHEPMRVICVHSREQILPELDARLGQHALKLLQKRGVEFRLGAKTRAASVEGVYLGTGELIPTRTIVCTVGNAPNPILKGLGEEQDGRLVADEFLRVKGRGRVWTLGDCARVPDGRGGIAPPTAQFASRQGDIAGRNIAAAMVGKPLRAFQHKSLGQLATLGHLNAVASFGKLLISGFPAWWLWRTVYLMKLPRLDRKLRVVIDWTLNLFFPRDLNSLDVTRRPGHATIHLEAGETLFRQGDPSAAFYVVESGSIQLTRCDEQKCVQGCYELGPGDHFGEGSLLRGGVRATTAVATKPTTVRSFPAKEFAALMGCWKGLRKVLEGSSRRFQPVSAVIPKWVPAEELQQPVSTVMSSPAFTLAMDTPLQQCLQDFVGRRFHCFPLLGDDGRLAGIVTSSDLFGALRSDVDLQQPLAAIATRNVRCLGPEEPIERAVEIMRRLDVEHVVIVDADRRVVGLVSMKDVLKLILRSSPVPAVPAEPVPT